VPLEHNHRVEEAITRTSSLPRLRDHQPLRAAALHGASRKADEVLASWQAEHRAVATDQGVADDVADRIDDIHPETWATT